MILLFILPRASCKVPRVLTERMARRNKELLEARARVGPHITPYKLLPLQDQPHRRTTLQCTDYHTCNNGIRQEETGQ